MLNESNIWMTIRPLRNQYNCAWFQCITNQIQYQAFESQFSSIDIAYEQAHISTITLTFLFMYVFHNL